MTQTKLRLVPPLVPPDMPLPPGAMYVDDWYDIDSPEPARYFRGSSWLIKRDNRNTDMCLLVDGSQYVDGRVNRFVVLDDDAMTVAQARQLAAALVAAADEIDRNQSDTYTV